MASGASFFLMESTLTLTQATRDYELVRRVFDALYPAQPCFTQADILTVLEAHPDWLALNQHIQQKPATQTQDRQESIP